MDHSREIRITIGTQTTTDPSEIKATAIAAFVWLFFFFWVGFLARLGLLLQKTLHENSAGLTFVAAFNDFDTQKKTQGISVFFLWPVRDKKRIAFAARSPWNVLLQDEGIIDKIGQKNVIFKFWKHCFWIIQVYRAACGRVSGTQPTVVCV